MGTSCDRSPIPPDLPCGRPAAPGAGALRRAAPPGTGEARVLPRSDDARGESLGSGSGRLAAARGDAWLVSDSAVSSLREGGSRRAAMAAFGLPEGATCLERAKAGRWDQSRTEGCRRRCCGLKQNNKRFGPGAGGCVRGPGVHARPKRVDKSCGPGAPWRGGTGTRRWRVPSRTTPVQDSCRSAA